MNTTPILPLGATPEADDFQVYSLKPAVRFLSKGVQPPSQVYVTTNDDIIAGCATSATGEVVTVSYRLLRADGELILGQFQVRPANDRSVSVHQESLAEGFLLSVSCKASVATTRGVTFARLFLSNPSLGQGQPSYMLMADYVTTAMAPAHPNGRNLAPVEGPGAPKTYQATLFGGGALFQLSVPANARWKVIDGWAQYLTDATPGNRTMSYSMTSSGNLVYQTQANAVQAPSTSVIYAAAQLPSFAPPTAGLLTIPLPPGQIFLFGDFIQSQVIGSAGGDGFSQVNFAVEEWLDNV